MLPSVADPSGGGVGGVRPPPRNFFSQYKKGKNLGHATPENFFCMARPPPPRIFFWIRHCFPYIPHMFKTPTNGFIRFSLSGCFRTQIFVYGFRVRLALVRALVGSSCTDVSVACDEVDGVARRVLRSRLKIMNTNLTWPRSPVQICNLLLTFSSLFHIILGWCFQK